MSEINHDEVADYIELRGVYDGWSIARMKDGSWVNRWEEGDPRYKRTQRTLEWMKMVDVNEKSI